MYCRRNVGEEIVDSYVEDHMKLSSLTHWNFKGCDGDHNWCRPFPSGSFTFFGENWQFPLLYTEGLGLHGHVEVKNNDNNNDNNDNNNNNNLNSNVDKDHDNKSEGKQGLANLAVTHGYTTLTNPEDVSKLSYKLWTFEKL